ncbi:hypothetical protein GLOIN_2v1768393 [Rhizophagus clarus]|uniref:Uncharacterized protein n=1 Tax=Rhizophagus clarus TaxID=94130 RepID=A0A8H3R1U7_9GLOM|nr:hypothetical protein GLOIN_2v1768393 [Rhizophagus clarus]
MEEIHNYPFNSVIKFKQPWRSFSYKVIKEGTYPNKESLAYTLPPNKYRIPDDYIIETTWGRSTNQYTVQCFINYNDNKPVFQVCNSTLTRRATSTGKHMITKFNEEVPKFYNMEEIPVLENIRYSVKNHIFDVHYGENKARKKQKIESVVRALDEGNISREPYRRLCAIESHLPREGVVSKERQKINEKMAQLIPISIVDINTKNQVDQSEEEDIEDEDIVQEVINAAGKGGYRNIKDILQYLVPDLIQKRVLNPHHPIINLRISGDGRNVGKKIKHVIITVAILDDKNTLHKPNHYYTIVLYPGCENYDSLSHMMAPFCHDLRDLKDHGLVINNIRWNFQFYFSSDWKFLAICLGFNSANTELVEQNSFNDTARKIIIDEMKKIKVNFQFWQDQGSKTWNYTSLMGNDKLKVLQFFDLTKILSRRRTAIVRDLWDKFYELYIKMKDPTTNAEDFKNDAKNWLTLFLTPSEGIPNTQEFKKGLYQPDNITPYIHVLVYHISKFMTIHHKWGLKAFSCSGIEKKNHEQVSYFFRKTMKDGGGKKKSQSSAIVEILQHENQTLFYNHNNIPLNCQNPKTIHIKTQDI